MSYCLSAVPFWLFVPLFVQPTITSNDTATNDGNQCAVFMENPLFLLSQKSICASSWNGPCPSSRLFSCQACLSCRPCSCPPCRRRRAGGFPSRLGSWPRSPLDRQPLTLPELGSV